MPSLPVYLDGHATNPLAPEARDAMFAALSEPGNPTSPHVHGELAARLVSRARRQVADLIGAAPSEIIFTSGATEANNLAILGLARRAISAGDPRRRIAISTIEHKSVLAPAKALASEGFAVDFLPVGRDGRLAMEALTAAVGPDTLLVSVMAANNETGVVQDLSEISRIAHAAGALIHSDAAQAAGKIEIDVAACEIDYASLSSHKLYGPTGVGALFIAAGAPAPAPLLFGGGQQGDLRPGTEPAALLSGFGAAADLARRDMAADQDHGRRLVDRLCAGLAARQVRFAATSEAPKVPGSLSFEILNVEAEDLIQRISDKVSISTGSACNSGQITPSHVLTSMNLTSREIASTVRVFCGRYTTDLDIDIAVDAIATEVSQTRS